MSLNNFENYVKDFPPKIKFLLKKYGKLANFDKLSADDKKKIIPSINPGEHDKEIRTFVYELIKDENFRDKFFGMNFLQRIVYLIGTVGLNLQEAIALSKLEKDNVINIKVGRPPGSPLMSVEFTILTL